MKNMLRVAAVVNRVEVGNPKRCLTNIEGQLAELREIHWDLLVLPRMSLCSPNVGDILYNRALLASAWEQLEQLQEKTRETPGILLVGLPVTAGGKPVEVVAVLQAGVLLGCIPALGQTVTHLDGGLPLLPWTTIWELGGIPTIFWPGSPEELPLYAGQLSDLGCQLVVVPACEPATAGSRNRGQSAAQLVSRTLGCGVVVVNGGIGETSSPWCGQGYACIYEEGRLLGEESSGRSDFTLTRDLDRDILAAVIKMATPAAPFHTLIVEEKGELPLALLAMSPHCPKDPIARQEYQQRLFTQRAANSPGPSYQSGEGKIGLPLRLVEQNPYLPLEPIARQEYLLELFDLQVTSLAARLQNTGFDHLVVGVSGGLDSTLALLVAAAACDRMHIPRENIYGITMPGFGTSDRTYYNALGLIEGLGATSRDIPIGASVMQHFEDIGHSPADHDITYENAQARERTQILLDLANKVSGLVVGTGDMTEEALGWCTFGGDHLANYNVNVCLTKTMVREVVRLIAEDQLLPGVEEFLLDVLDTPVSPELLPTDDQGEIVQQSEGILGPYEIHEFFLWYLARYQLGPAKVLEYAVAAFGEKYSEDYLRDRLHTFVRLFIKGQFKRSCAPDAASITDFNLTGIQYSIPSDLSPLLLQELEPSAF